MDFRYGDRVYNKYTQEYLIYNYEAETEGLCWTTKLDEDGNDTKLGYSSELSDVYKED